MSGLRLFYSSVLASIVVSRFAPEWTSAALLLALLLNLSYAVFWIFVYPFHFSPLRDLPEPKGAKFPWAHADLIMQKHNGEPYRQWLHSTPNEGLIRFRVLMNEERVLLTSPRALREVLVTKAYVFEKLEKPQSLFRALLGNGLLAAEGEEHQAQRKAIAPAFSFRHIKDLYPVFWSKARESVQAISTAQKYSSKDKAGLPLPQSAYLWSSRVALDVIGLAGAGHDFHALQHPDSELLTTYRGLFEDEGPMFFWSSIGLEMPVGQIIKLPMPGFRTLWRAKNRIGEFAQDLIREKQQKMKASDEEEGDILSIAMGSGAFTEQGLVDQLMTFLAAGHETTASSLVWAVYLLCKHSDIQTRLRKEVREHLPSISAATSTVDSQQVDKVAYLNAVCNEVLRFFSPVPMTARVAASDTEICGHPIPKGTNVIIAAWATNVDFSLWGEDAMDFNPDRWLEKGQAQTGGAPSNFANLTFIHGARSCIGKDFAKSEFLCLLAAWVGRFEMSFPGGVVPEVEIEGYVTAKPKTGMPIVFKEVEGW